MRVTMSFSNESGKMLNSFETKFYQNSVADKIQKLFPVKFRLFFWGDSLFMDIPSLSTEGCEETETVVNGDIVYWEPGSQIQLFYGKTPNSLSDAPAVKGPVIPVGKFETDYQAYKLFVKSLPPFASYIDFAAGK